MRGITPVIAIILLLLMTVAAAGGFYFFYQRFTSEGEDSGTRQVDQLGEQALARLSIESAAGGRIYIRNTGAISLDLTQATLYVENVPVATDRSTDRLDEKNRAVLKLTELPDCTAERCEVRITGPASVSQIIDLSRLLCSSNSDCRTGEICVDGLCVENGEELNGFCGDGICDYPTEHGLNCIEDCRIEMFIISDLDPSGGDHDIYSFLWNGDNYEKHENITASDRQDTAHTPRYDSSGNILFVGSTGPNFPGGCPGENDPSHQVFYGFYDGIWTVDNITDTPWPEGAHASLDFNDEDEAIAVWVRGVSWKRDVAWSKFSEGEWTTPTNLTTPSDASAGCPSVRFGPDGDALALWSNWMPGEINWLNYSYFDGVEWGSHSVLVETEDENFFAGDDNVIFNSTHAIAVWSVGFGGLGRIDYSVYHEGSWSSPKIAGGGEAGPLMYPQLTFDENGLLVMTYWNGTQFPNIWPEYATYDGESWSGFENLTDPNPTGIPVLLENQYGSIMIVTANIGLLSGEEPLHSEFLLWDGINWSEPVVVLT